MRLTTLLFTSLLILPAIAEEETTPLGKEMSSLNDTLKLIKRSDNPGQAAQLARDAQNTLLKAFDHLPEMLAKVPEGPEKTRATAEYRLMLSEALTILCKIEQAWLAGDASTAEALRKEIHQLKEKAHERFMPEE